MCLSGAGGASGGFERHKRRTPPSHYRNAANCVFRPVSSSLQRPVMLMDFLKCHCSLTQSHESTSPCLSARLNGQKTTNVKTSRRFTAHSQTHWLCFLLKVSLLSSCSVEPTFSDTTIGGLYTIPACHWSKYYSVITYTTIGQ